MPALKTPFDVTKDLNAQYDKWALYISQNKRNTQGVWFNTDSCSIYVRNMARGILIDELVFCISNININKEYQNQSILTGFLNHVLKDAKPFSEIEIENIQTERLLNFFLKRGFKKTEPFIHMEDTSLTVFKKLI